MRRLCWFLVGFVPWIGQVPARGADPPPFALKDGDRVVLIGDALIERDQKYGYLETFLTIQNPDKNLTFRNLGWSGDTVFGDARAGFGTRADGFKHLRDHLLALKPTVIFAGYGMSDSFEGERGLPQFVKGLNVLLDVFAETKAQVVLLSPVAHEDLGRPLPDPAKHNEDLKAYRAALSRAAKERGHHYVELLGPNELRRESAEIHLTEDGIHPTSLGYYVIAALIDFQLLLGDSDSNFDIQLGHDGRVNAPRHSLATISQVEKRPDGLRFEVRDAGLVYPMLPRTAPASLKKLIDLRTVRFTRLAPGKYILKIDARPVATATSAEWERGVSIRQGPDIDQVDRLRKTINEKNLLYFYRWRPQNETYLFGFRKYEQGNNAREIPLFDPLVAEKEKEIAQLRKPVPHVYELVRESEVAK